MFGRVLLAPAARRPGGPCSAGLQSTQTPSRFRCQSNSRPTGVSMSYRTRLLITFLLFILGINGLSLAVQYQLARRTMYDALRAKALSVAATTATLIDGDLHRQLQTRDDENSPA